MVVDYGNNHEHLKSLTSQIAQLSSSLIMTITKDSSAPLVVVVGVTGNQGGSVAKALAESDKPYRIRGLTRDVTKSAAREFAAGGVEMVAVSLTSDNAAAAREVFKGADIVFVVTNYWEHLDVNREISEGKMLIDTAKAAGVGLFIWSGLESIIKVSNGKYPNVHHFNGKGEITEYGRRSGIPFVNVQSGWYASNFWKLDGMKPKKVADGTYVLALPVGPQTLLPVIDTPHDYGLFVREAIESPEFGPGSEVLTSGEDITVGDMISQLAEITGKKISYARIGDQEFMTATGMPPSIALEVLESFKYHEECGYYAGKSTEASRRHLARPTRTWADFVKSTDWSSVLA
ncbi:NAD(P)-binding protein [Mycena galopus ATCC 62051]|nr:NAD(P)-binding protein [Mycena galopus ATCC 62051]